jgi:transposase
MQFGRSSGQIDAEIAQLELTLEDLEMREAAVSPAVTAVLPERVKPVRRPLPESLPREIVVHETACKCPECGTELAALGEDVAEMLEYVPRHFKVIRHVRILDRTENSRFAGADCGGERAAAIYSLIGTA